MRGKQGKKLYYTDFNRLEKASYKGLTSFAKEIVDRMVEMSTGETPELTPEIQAKIDLVMEAFKDLTNRQMQVLELIYGLNDKPIMTEEEIAKELNISPPGVHDLKRRALKSLSKRVLLDEDAVQGINGEETEEN